MAAIEIHGLHKSFGRREVLRGIDLSIRPGRVSAVLGPNASGKTTLIKAILGLVKPDTGLISIDGVELDGTWSYRERFGYMPQAPRFPEQLSAAEVLDMLRDIRRDRGRLDTELRRVLDVEEHFHRPLGTLSGGTRQKISAIMAFYFEPDTLVLDEPTAGLDPVSSSALKDRILRERDRGCTVVLTSHVMSEVEELADDVAFLLEGRIKFAGSIEDIKAGTMESRLERAIARLMLSNAGESAAV